MQPVAPSFEPVPKGRGSIKPGTLYAVSGEGGWIYYGQVSPTQDVGFFRHRTRAIMDAPEVLEMEVMCRILIAHRSIGEAVRSGHWRTLGRHEPSPGLLDPCAMVQWPIGTPEVTVWTQTAQPGSATRTSSYVTTIDDPAIQQFEILAAWDAIYHVPGRLTADFCAEPCEWYVGGPVWRARRVAAEMARRRRHP